jgi:DnaJ-domain-containing protein 1
MGEAKRRKPVSRKEAERMGRAMNAAVETVEVKGDMAEICSGTAAYLLEGSVDRTLLFGPVIWRPSDGTSARRWCFIVVGCDRTGETRHDQLGAETEDDTVALRSDIMAALVAHRPCVAIDFNDELEMAKVAEANWPCAKITRIRQGIEAERAAWMNR